ncbi:MAG: aminotransferase class V-fold PLP-dependent enzyme [Chitinophagales bacterium]|nr:aminotransferase class V-fold PLP-dependent enzyme [Chitinophagales bacterium]
MATPSYSPYTQHWQLDSSVTFLNHGSFGACPLAVLQKQAEYRRQMEQEPVRFMVRELEPLIWKSKEALANFIGAKAADLAFVPNATTGVNTVLNALHFSEGDELLTTNHGYGACVNALQWFADKAKAKMIKAEVPFPVSSEEEIIDAILSKVTSKTRLLMIDHITSATGIIFPVQRIVSLLKEKGIDCLIDGAHAPGHLNLNIKDIGAAYYTGNCHKWICSPKGAAFLYVDKEKKHLIHPMVVSHLYDQPIEKERLWSSHFFWPGTNDYSAYLCVKDAIEYLDTLFPGGWQELKNYNRNLCLNARAIIAEKIQTELPAPENMIANLSTLYIGKTNPSSYGFNYLHPLQEDLWNKYKIEVPVFVWSRKDPRLWVRISAQCYNSVEQYKYLGEALASLLESSFAEYV